MSIADPTLDPFVASSPTLLEQIGTLVFGYDCFVSYEWDSGNVYAQALVDRLHAERRRCFLDRIELVDGVRIDPAIETALRKSKTLVIVATSEALASESVRKEVEFFKDTRRPIIPININRALSEGAPGDTLAGFLWGQLATLEPTPSPTSPSPEVVVRLVRSWRFTGTIARTIQLLVLVAVVLGALALAASVLAVVAEVARRREQQARMRTMSSTGVALVNSGQEFTSLPWFSAAYRLAAGDAGAEREQRLRLADLLRWLPKVKQVFPGDIPPRDFLFSPDGRRVAIARGHSATIWGAEDASRTAGPLDLPNEITRLEFSPDSGRLLAAGWSPSVMVWNADTGAPVYTLPHGEAVAYATYSRDGSKIVTCGDKGSVRVWDAGSAGLIVTIGHPGRVGHAAFDETGSKLGTACDDGTARIWDAATGRPISSFQQGSAIQYLAFSDRGDRVVSASGQTCDVWESSTGRKIGNSFFMVGRVTRAGFTIDGDWLFAASDQQQLSWIIATGELVPASGGVTNLAYAPRYLSPDRASVLWSLPDNSVRIYDSISAQSIEGARRLRHADGVWSVSFSGDGKRIATASDDRTARVWDAATGAPITAGLRHNGRVVQARLNPDGTLLATASADGTAHVWDVNSGVSLNANRQPRDVNDVSFNARGNLLVSANDDTTAMVWGIGSGFDAPLGMPLRHASYVNVAAFSPDGGRILTATSDGMAVLWDADARLPALPPFVHQSILYHAAFSPEGGRIVTASGDGTARIWNAVSGREATPPLRHAGAIYDAAFSPDGGRRVVTAGADRTARVWDALTGAQLTRVEHTDEVLHAAFSPDGRSFATAGRDGIARVWATTSGEPITLPWRHDRPIRNVAFSPDGTRVATASLDGYAKVWAMPDADRPAEGLVAMSEFLAGETVSPEGTLVAPEASSVLPTWRRLERSRTNLPRPTREEEIAFHDKELGICEPLHRWPEALIHASELFRRDPGDWRVSLRLGNVRRELGDYRGAIVDLGRAIELQPGRPELLRKRAEAYADAGLWLEAAEAYEEAWEALDPQATRSDRLAILRPKADASARIGRWKEAANDLAQMTALGQPDANDWHMRALALAAAGDRRGYAAVCRDLVAALGASPSVEVGETIAWTCLIGAGADKETVKQAVRLLATADRVFDDPARPLFRERAALYRAGQVGLQRGESDDLASLVETVQQRVPSESERDLLFTAMIEQAGGQVDRAAATAERAVRVLARTTANGRPIPARPRTGDWSDRLELKLLRDECGSRVSYIPPVLVAIANRDLDQAAVLIRAGGDVNAGTLTGTTPLHVAAKDWEQAARLLLDSGARTELRDGKGMTPLHIAVLFDNAATTRLLLQHRAAIEARANNGQTPLLLASNRGSLEVVKLLLGAGADPTVREYIAGFPPVVVAAANGEEDGLKLMERYINNPSADGNAPIHAAVFGSIKQLARKAISLPQALKTVDFLVANGADINRRNNRGESPLDLAVLAQNLAFVRRLLERGADPSTKDPVTGGTPLRYAAQFGNIPIMEALLDAHVDIEIKDQAGFTPVEAAVAADQADSIRFLISRGASPDPTDATGKHPLEMAAASGKSRCVRALLDGGARPDLSSSGMAALHSAAFRGNLEMCTDLVEHGANVNLASRDGRGLTPLRMALLGGRTEIARYLLEHGADERARDREGHIALHAAVLNSNADMVRVLLARGSDVDSPDRDGRTPLHYAVLKADLPTAALLLERGAKVGTANRRDGSTPLHGACALRQVELVRLLLDHGARWDAADFVGNTPLHVVAANSLGEGAASPPAGRPDFAIVELLCERGADVNARRVDRATAVHLSAVVGDSGMIALLLGHGADARARDERDRMPADLAEMMRREAGLAALRARPAVPGGRPPINRVPPGR
jgi:WD40 repeat protein/ankyrin repeat protein/tetratricopeptide (TPR) repeat protein